MKKTLIASLILCSTLVHASPIDCTPQGVQNALSEVGFNPHLTTTEELVNDFLDGYVNIDELTRFIKENLSDFDVDQPLTPFIISNFHSFTNIVDLQKMDMIFDRLEASKLPYYVKLDTYSKIKNVDFNVTDTSLFEDVSFIGLQSNVTDYYGFLKGKQDSNGGNWDDVKITGGQENRPEVVFNTSTDALEATTSEDFLKSLARAMNNSSSNSGSKLSSVKGLQDAWKADVDSGNITNPDFMYPNGSIEDHMDIIFEELFVRMYLDDSPNREWKNLASYFESDMLQIIKDVSPHGKINYNNVPHHFEIAYNKMDLENPRHQEWLDEAGFLEESSNGNFEIDEDFMREEGNSFPNLEETFPKLYQPTPTDKIKSLVSRSLKGDTSVDETTVTVWRGTWSDRVEDIADNKTAGGLNTNPDVGRPTREEALQQVEQGRILAEYTSNISVADRFSRGYFAVAIDVKVKYLRKGSESEEGWVMYHDAPVDVLYIIDRTNNNKEVDNGNAS